VSPSNHARFPRNMKFARAMSNGVGLHCPDLTAGTPVYTPDELGVDDPDADVSPDAHAAAEVEAAADAPPPPSADPTADQAPRSGDLIDAALEGGYSAATVVELCRFFYDQPRLTALSDEQASEMAGRLRLARVQRVSDDKLRSVAKHGLGRGDPRRVRAAADLWLTFRGAERDGESPAA
jgi:hypothetical protein